MSSAVEGWLCDVLLSAEEVGFRYRGKKLSEAMDSLDAYATLTDSVFDVIDFLAVDDTATSGSGILENVRRRHLHKHVGEVVCLPSKEMTSASVVRRRLTKRRSRGTRRQPDGKLYWMEPTPRGSTSRLAWATRTRRTSLLLFKERRRRRLC